MQDAHDHADARRLARAVRAQQPAYHPARHFEVEVLDRGVFSEALRYTLESKGEAVVAHLVPRWKPVRHDPGITSTLALRESVPRPSSDPAKTRSHPENPLQTGLFPSVPDMLHIA